MYVFTDSRFCHIQYGDLEDHIHNYDGKTPHNAWNEEEYNAHKIQEEFREDEMDIEMAEVDFALNLFNEYGDPSDSDNSSGNNSESDDVSAANFGLKRKCVFNQLKSFHCVTSMPPESMHDLMEGRKLKQNLNVFVLKNENVIKVDYWKKVLLSF